MTGDERPQAVEPNRPFLAASALPPERIARRLVRLARKAALGTLMGPSGDPCVSLVGIATLDDGSPLLLISGLALHTRNLRQDPRVSLLIEPAATAADPMTEARVSLFGRAEKTTDANARDCYLAVHPDAATYVDFADFSFWRIHIASAHLVAGFGRIHDVRGEQMRIAPAPYEPGKSAARDAEIWLTSLNPDWRISGFSTYLPSGTWSVIDVDAEGVNMSGPGGVERLELACPLHLLPGRT